MHEAAWEGNQIKVAGVPCKATGIFTKKTLGTILFVDAVLFLFVNII